MVGLYPGNWHVTVVSNTTSQSFNSTLAYSGISEDGRWWAIWSEVNQYDTSFTYLIEKVSSNTNKYLTRSSAQGSQFGTDITLDFRQVFYNTINASRTDSSNVAVNADFISQAFRYFDDGRWLVLVANSNLPYGTYISTMNDRWGGLSSGNYSYLIASV